MFITIMKENTPIRVACVDAGRENGQRIACVVQASKKNGESAESLCSAQRLSEQCTHPFALIREHQIFALLRGRPATASETAREYLETQLAGTRALRSLQALHWLCVAIDEATDAVTQRTKI